MKNSMKRNILIALFAVVSLAGWAQENNYTIKFDPTSFVEENASIDSFYLVDLPDRNLITEKYAYQGKEINISGKVGKPQNVNLILIVKIAGGVRTQYIPLILETGNIVIMHDKQHSHYVSGTPLNDAMFAAMRDINQARQTNDLEKVRQLIIDYIKEHNNDVTAVSMLWELYLKTAKGAKDALTLIGQCNKDVQQHPSIVQLVKLISCPKEGDMFKDFSVEYEGKTTRLSDYVGKGQYVLVDFWASWCGPCRGEIPNLIAAYNKYKEKGLQVLGVAAWDKPKDTLKAIGEEKVPYPQILNSQKIATELYGVNSIPEIILFAPDGKIVKRSLRGGEIEKTLAKIFGKE